MLKLTYRNWHTGDLSRMLIRFLRIVLIVPGAIIVELAPALALDGS